MQEFRVYKISFSGEINVVDGSNYGSDKGLVFGIISYKSTDNRKQCMAAVCVGL